MAWPKTGRYQRLRSGTA